MPKPLSSNANVNVKIEGVGSQALVVALSVIACLCTGATIYFAWHEHASAWVPGGLTILFTALACWKHGLSQKTLDLRATPPVKVSANGLSVELPAATVADSSAVRTLEGLIANAFHRTPLPPPDGVVGPDFTPDQSPQALISAQELVTRINQECTQMHSEIGNLFQQSGSTGAIELQPHLQPPIDIPTLSSHLMPQSDTTAHRQG